MIHVFAVIENDLIPGRNARLQIVSGIHDIISFLKLVQEILHGFLAVRSLWFLTLLAGAEHQAQYHQKDRQILSCFHNSFLYVSDPNIACDLIHSISFFHFDSMTASTDSFRIRMTVSGPERIGLMRMTYFSYSGSSSSIPLATR